MRKLLSALRTVWPGQTGASQPQLRMRYGQSSLPSTGCVEPPYTLREFRQGDEEGWVTLLNGGGELGVWDLGRLRSEISSFLVPDAQFFVLCDRQIVSGAGVYERSAACWEIGWVATRPHHRGRGLARHVCRAAVGAAFDLPARPIWLFTDDFRTRAIRLYLTLGFVPDCHHASHSRRWRAVFEQLGPEYQKYGDSYI